MGQIIDMSIGGWRKRWYHKLFQCATYWRFWKPYPFRCPVCNKGYRCYWDGNDVNHLIDVCNGCAPYQRVLEKSTIPVQLQNPAPPQRATMKEER